MNNHLILACMVALPLTANAALIDYGSITYDDVSGLGWLDTTTFVGQSYNQVESQMRAGALYDGYRHATKLEVGEIFIQLDLPFGYNGSPLSGVDTLIDLFGDTATAAVDVSGVFGMSAPDSNSTATYGAAFHRLNIGTSEVIFIGGFGRTQTDSAVGHWVVIDNYQPTVVPVPAAAWLFGSGLIGLIGIARRKVNA